MGTTRSGLAANLLGYYTKVANLSFPDCKTALSLQLPLTSKGEAEQRTMLYSGMWPCGERARCHRAPAAMDPCFPNNFIVICCVAGCSTSWCRNASFKQSGSCIAQPNAVGFRLHITQLQERRLPSCKRPAACRHRAAAAACKVELPRNHRSKDGNACELAASCPPRTLSPKAAAASSCTSCKGDRRATRCAYQRAFFCPRLTSRTMHGVACAASRRGHKASHNESTTEKDGVCSASRTKNTSMISA